MSEVTQTEKQEFIIGRYGVFIPEIDTEQLTPAEFLQFFRDTLATNMKEFEDRDVNMYYSQANAIGYQFVIPSLEENPMVLMEYSQSGYQTRFGDSATHKISIGPDNPGSFRPFLQIDHPINLESLRVKPADGESLTFYTHPGTWREFERESIEDRRNLGRIATDFVELVS